MTAGTTSAVNIYSTLHRCNNFFEFGKGVHHFYSAEARNVEERNVVVAREIHVIV